ncbi:sulfurtransferase TusA family protein [Frigidibacter mobilis]|uniref:SirA family protein n=1 Tax=Frigidibacter mobilis TaxID=1335048 RepID=A0A159Z290_9RHOB|nr:sulfurtransferase TusA family protein [Frigidibacter mobilis]AMY69102.1 SirA family protein [Frigidibacter mobilis]
MEIALEIDARGLLCPLPVLKVRKALLGLPPGAVLRLWASDPMARIDIPHFCAEAGHELLAAEDAGGGQVFTIRRG